MNPASREHPAAADAVLAAACLAADPAGLGGAWVRAPAGPTRDRWLGLLRSWLPAGAPWRRLPVNVADGRLLGGLDLAATLGAGRPVAERGLLAESHEGVLVAVMAERMEPGVAARIAVALDTGEVGLERDGLAARHPARLCVLALDEGCEADERAPAALVERLAFVPALDGLREADLAPGSLDASAVARARRLAVDVAVEEAAVTALVGAALALGIDSARPLLYALRTTRVVAALEGRTAASPEDVARAARLVFAPRATRLPEAPPADPAPEPPPEELAGHRDDEARAPLEDRVVEAVAAALPPGVLEQLRAAGNDRARPASAGRRGASRRSRLRGRPAGARPGDPRSGDRLDLVATLRAAVPWQRLRCGPQPPAVPARATRLAVGADDFRVRRFRQRRATTIVFVVDASGSTALHRLGEAKGAVELLLADCYVRRDRVALLAYRGAGAELLLPPTRSLVRAKRSLAGLPGGGGTPLAAGIEAAAALADALRRRGETPYLVFLGDGGANVALDGRHGRAPAFADAEAAATRLGASGVAAVVLDAAPRPGPQSARLAALMRAHYLPLPRADAAAVSRAVAIGLAPGRADGA